VAVEHCSSPGAESLPGLWLEPGVMPEYRSKAVLRELGIPVPDGRIAGTLDAAIGVAGEIGFPIALKAQAADLPHKSDAGGVVLGLKDEEELATGWGELQRNIATSMPGLVLDGVLVERMSEKGLELILGCRNDPDWGPVLLAGSGGVLAEALHDTILMPPDLSVDGIVRKLMKLKCAPLLRGFRGSPALDVRAAADILVKIGLLVRSAPGIQEIDINPVIVYPEGEGAVALDALIVSADEQSAATNKISS
jgi:acetate---CoA ligase (ADP-forming)